MPLTYGSVIPQGLAGTLRPREDTAPMSAPYALEHWLPRELVARCGQRSLSDFVEDYADTYFLLIRLWDRYDNFTTSLMSREAALLDHDRARSGSFTTAEHATTVARLRAGGALEPPERVGAAKEAQNDLCFLLPLCPKQAGDKPSRLTVGRSRAREVLLQHRSVSQLHAWFDFDAGGQLFLTDADSKNKTLLNGERVGASPVLVSPGSALRFGAVRATLCEPATIWAVLAGQSEASLLSG